MNFRYCFLVILFFLPSLKSFSQDTLLYYQRKTTQKIPEDQQSIQHGERLFAGNCSKCHQMCAQLEGPSLADVYDRRPLSWLLPFIHNSLDVIKNGDAYANHFFNQYKGTNMPPFENLSDKDILDILAYIKDQSKGELKDSTFVTTPEEQKLMATAAERYQHHQAHEIDYYSRDADLADLNILNDKNAADAGRQLFLQQCATCHEMCARSYGPALASVTDRRPLPWLIDYINDPTEMIKSGDPYINYLLTNYDFIMPNFKFLQKDQVLQILAYIRQSSSSPVSDAGVNSHLATDQDNGAHQVQSLPVEHIRIPEKPYPNQNTTAEVAGKIFMIGFIVFFLALFTFVMIKIFKSF